MSEQPTSEYGDRNPSQRSPTGEKEDTEAKTQKATKTIPKECGSRTEQAKRETGNPEFVQGRATAAKKGQQRVERRHNRLELTAKKRKEKTNPGELNGKTTERRKESAEAKQRNKQTQREKKET